MNEEYKAYKCPACRGSMIAITADLARMKEDGRYLSCIYCGCKYIIETGKYDDMIRCMEEIPHG